MRKGNFLLIAVLIFFSSQIVFAQRGMGMMRNSRGKKLTVEQRIANLDRALNLSAEQRAQIKKIFENADRRMKEIYEQNKGNRTAMRSAMAEQREMTNTQIMNILSEKQKVAYAKYLKDRASQRSTMQNPARQGGGMGGGMGKNRW
jgi:hypothetical protein